MTTLLEEYVQLLNERRIKMGNVVRVDRVIKGKVKKRSLRSAKKGYKLVKGKLKKISPAEMRKRKLAAKRAARKRKAKLKQILRKRKISLMKGKRQGLYK